MGKKKKKSKLIGKPLKQRNPLWNHPLKKKGGKHNKKRKRDLQNETKE